MVDKITLCFKHVKKEIDAPEDYDELLESFHEKFGANKNNIYNFSYDDKFGQEHTLKKEEICASIFRDIKQLTVEEEIPQPDCIEEKINQIKERYEKKIKNLKETYEQKIKDKENQIENLNQQLKELKNEIDKLLSMLKEIQGNDALNEHKDKIEEFRKEYNLKSEDFKDEMLLKVLVENNFDFPEAFCKLLG